MKTVPNSHPYFEELRQFAQMTVANMSSLMLVAASKTISELVSAINLMVNQRSTNIKGNVNLHEMPDSVYLSDSRCQDAIILHDTDQIHAYIAGLRSKELDRVRYEMALYMEPEKPKPGRVSEVAPNPSARFQGFSAYLVGGAYEHYKAQFERRYGKNPRKWDPQLQFFRHIRNGCFHSNTFNIIPVPSGPNKGKPQIDSGSPPKWRNYVMTSDNAMNGTKVMNGFFHIHMIIPFLDDMGSLV